MKDFLNLKGQEKGSGQDQESGLNVDGPKKNCFYALCSRGGQETSPDVVNGMFNYFSTYVYVLLDLGATLYFVTPLVVINLTFCPIT